MLPVHYLRWRPRYRFNIRRHQTYPDIKVALLALPSLLFNKTAACSRRQAESTLKPRVKSCCAAVEQLTPSTTPHYRHRRRRRHRRRHRPCSRLPVQSQDHVFDLPRHCLTAPPAPVSRHCRCASSAPCAAGAAREDKHGSLVLTPEPAPSACVTLRPAVICLARTRPRTLNKASFYHREPAPRSSASASVSARFGWLDLRARPTSTPSCFVRYLYSVSFFCLVVALLTILSADLTPSRPCYSLAHAADTLL